MCQCIDISIYPAVVIVQSICFYSVYWTIVVHKKSLHSLSYTANDFCYANVFLYIHIFLGNSIINRITECLPAGENKKWQPNAKVNYINWWVYRDKLCVRLFSSLMRTINVTIVVNDNDEKCYYYEYLKSISVFLHLFWFIYLCLTGSIRFASKKSGNREQPCWIGDWKQRLLQIHVVPAFCTQPLQKIE